MKVLEPLRVVANTDNLITLSFELDFYETTFNLNLTKNESRRLRDDLDKWLEKENK